MENKVLTNEEFLKLNINYSKENFCKQFEMFKTIIENEKSEKKLEVINKIINEYLKIYPERTRTGISRDYYTGEEDGTTYTYIDPAYYYFNYGIEKFTPYLEKLAHKCKVQNYEKKDKEIIAILKEDEPER